MIPCRYAAPVKTGVTMKWYGPTASPKHPEAMFIRAHASEELERRYCAARARVQRLWREWPVCRNGYCVTLKLEEFRVDGADVDAVFVCDGCRSMNITSPDGPTSSPLPELPMVWRDPGEAVARELKFSEPAKEIFRISTTGMYLFTPLVTPKFRVGQWVRVRGSERLLAQVSEQCPESANCVRIRGSSLKNVCISAENIDPAYPLEGEWWSWTGCHVHKTTQMTHYAAWTEDAPSLADKGCCVEPVNFGKGRV